MKDNFEQENKKIIIAVSGIADRFLTSSNA